MDRIESAEAVFAALVVDDAAGAAVALAGLSGSFSDSLRACAAYWGADHAACTAFAAVALESAEAPVDRALALAMTQWARATDVHCPFTDMTEPLLAALAEVPVAGRLGAFVHALSIDAALMSGRVDVACELLPLLDFGAWRGHVLEVAFCGVPVRVLSFAGRVAEAADALPALRLAAARHGLGQWASACELLVAGASGAGVAEALAAVDATDVDGHTFSGRGLLMLGAYGAMSAGSVAHAYELVLRVGASCLELLTLADRAMAVEILVAGSSSRSEALAWAEHVADLAEHPTTAPIVLRVRARLALASGSAEAASLASRSGELAEHAGRFRESRHADVMRAEALVLGGSVAEASAVLRTSVRAAEGVGDQSFRPAAARVLSAARRRLPPRAGELSAREREVVSLLQQGMEDADIASALHVAVSTVRQHVGRAMQAYGVSSRVGLLAVLGAVGTCSVALELTPRQSAVVSLVAAGLSNAEIAEALGVSVKAVEAHVSGAMLRWGVGTRFGLGWVWGVTALNRTGPEAHSSAE